MKLIFKTNIMFKMRGKTRKILLFLFFLIFIISAPLLVFYFQGYRFDFKNKKLIQTGGLFLKIKPKQTKIYLDEKLSKETDFLFGSALIENLLPKKYNVKVKKEGYFDWEKNLEIREKEVTEARNVVLFPNDINFSFLSKGIKDVWLSPDERKMIFKEKKEDIWELKIYDLEKNLKSHLLKESDISSKGADLFDLEFSRDGKKIYFDTVIEEQLKKKSFVLEIDKSPPFLKETEKTLPPLENIITSQQINEEVYYLNNFGYLYKSDSSFSKAEKITRVPFPLKQETEYQLYVFSDFIFLIEGGKSLHLLNQETKLFENFFEGINSLKISPDFEKIVYFSDYEIQIFFLKESPKQPKREKGENMFLLRLSEKIKDVFWITPNHLIFSTENNIKITEIDNRDMINTIQLAEFSSFIKNYGESTKDRENLKIFWNSINERLYVLAKEILWVSNKLTP